MVALCNRNVYLHLFSSVLQIFSLVIPPAPQHPSLRLSSAQAIHLRKDSCYPSINSGQARDAGILVWRINSTPQLSPLFLRAGKLGRKAETRHININMIRIIKIYGIILSPYSNLQAALSLIFQHLGAVGGYQHPGRHTKHRPQQENFP